MSKREVIVTPEMANQFYTEMTGSYKGLEENEIDFNPNQKLFFESYGATDKKSFGKFLKAIGEVILEGQAKKKNPNWDVSGTEYILSSELEKKVTHEH